jgi:large subunit ribosomal protein L17
MLDSLLQSLVTHGRISTTHARAKAAQPLADRLVTWGKDGSIHARRQAFRILQDERLVKTLFTEVAPRFTDVRGGYTRVVRLGLRRGDGAQEALLAFSRLPTAEPPKAAAPPRAPKTPRAPEPAAPAPAKPGEKPKGLFEGLRTLWTRRKKGSAAA